MWIYALEKNIPIRVELHTCIVINKVYLVTTWSNSSYTINLKKKKNYCIVFSYISYYI